MNTRLKQFLAAENISQAQFADSINVVRASVSHVLAGRNNPSYDFIKSIMDNYPQLNIEWLILGKGKMYKEKDQPQVAEVETGLLFEPFPEETEELTLAEQDIPVLLESSTQNIASSSKIEASSTQSQVAVKQRKVTKIIVLFDDGSFQEM